MNFDHLGDAFDHWKGSILEFLTKTKVLRNLAVDAMASDRKPWPDGCSDVYSKLLRVRKKQIFVHEKYLGDDRKAYFKELSMHSGDIFLDPDVGIATGRATKRHITPSELAELLKAHRNRIVIVYQHVRGKKTSERVNECIGAIEGEGAEVERFGWSSYESPNVAMIFLSLESRRTRNVRDAFKELLGGFSEKRCRQQKEQ